MLTCNKCGLDLPESKFDKRPESPTGRRYHCRDCRTPQTRLNASIQGAKRREAIREYVRNAKSDKPCMDCGEVYAWYCMDFDHREGESKKINVSNLQARATNLRIVAEEIAKCDLVCANCHRVRTYLRRQWYGWPPPNGGRKS